MTFYDKEKIRKFKSKGKQGIKNLKKGYTSLQKAPKIGQREINKITKSKKFKIIKRKAGSVKRNIDNYFVDQRDSLKDFYPGKIRF